MVPHPSIDDLSAALQMLNDILGVWPKHELRVWVDVAKMVHISRVTEQEL